MLHYNCNDKRITEEPRATGLRMIRHFQNTQHSEALTQPVDNVPLAAAVDSKVAAKNSVSSVLQELFSPSLRLLTVLLMIIWFTLSFGSYGLAVWMPTLFNKVGFAADIYMETFFFVAASLPGNLVAFFLIDHPLFGRKRLMVASMLLSGISALFFARSQSSFAGTIAVACLFSAFSSAGWCSLDCLSSENFPTSVRSSAMGLLASSGRLGSIVAQFVNAQLMELSVPLLLLITSGTMLVGGLLGCWLPADDIEHHLDDHKPDSPSEKTN
jgi:VNT family MFS transporter (synaptic vesicle glycoprotein 2)